MRYWIVENGKLVKILNRLNEFAGASFPQNVTDETLKTFWILPIKGEALADFEYWNEEIEYEVFDKYILEKKGKTERPLNEYKTTKGNLLKSRCKEDILNEYSEATQRNIIMNKDEEAENFNQMKTFISKRKDKYGEQLLEIEKCETCLSVLEYVNTQIEPLI